MAYTSEIEKLERRWLENPKGRNFAPLADAYRKAGELDRAIDLCKSGLERHPDYVSAHIVYGRCLIDMKNDAGAQEAFQKVLALDPENIIALKILGEVAERNNRFDEAVDWLARLLNADPMNGEAAEHLARAKTRAAAAKPTPAIADAATAAMTKPDFVVEHTDAAPVTPLAASTPTPDVETFDGSLDFNAAAHSAAKAEGLEVQEDVELNSQQIEQVDVIGLARTQYEGSGMFKLDIPSPEVQPPVPELSDDAIPQVDLPLIMPDDMPAAQASARRPEPAPPPPPRPPAASAIPAAVALSDDDGAADTATLSQAEPVLTETMAELYLKQGHQHDALRVYQALLAQRPSDARLRRKIEQLSGGGHTRHGSGVSAQSFLKGIWSGRAAVPAPAPVPPPIPRPPALPAEPEPPEPPAAARASTPAMEQSTLDGAFDAADGEGSTPGEPSHPAKDHISLDSVFGDDSARRSGNAASAESGRAAAGGGGGGSGGFSFDDFFGGAPPGGGQGVAPAQPTAEAGAGGGASAEPGGARTPGRSSGRAQRPPEDEVEADQFQQWLKKLKA